MSKWLQFDERTERVTGKLSFIFLGLVQIILLIMIVYQRYFLDRPSPYYNDLAVLLGICTVGYWLASLYLGGVLPMLTIRQGVLVYLVLVGAIALPYTMIRGFPGKDILLTWILVIAVAPGLLLGGYTLAASLGAKRLERLSNPNQPGGEING